MQPELSPIEIEKTLLKKLFLDFGDSGIEYLKRKKEQISIKSFSEIDEEVQMRFIYYLCKDLYGDILSKNRFDKYVKGILHSLYDKYSVYSFMFWIEFFKGSSPINYMEHFFGKNLGSNLSMIHENKKKITSVNNLPDYEQFDFISSLINELTKDNLIIRKSLFSNFIKYVMYGESRSLKLRGFINIHRDLNGSFFLSSVKNYINENSTNNSSKNVFEVIDSLQDLIKPENKTNYDDQSHFGYIDLDEIKNMLGRYIGNNNANQVVHNAMINLSISDINSCKRNTKKDFIDYVIEKSEIGSYSKQKQKIVKTLLFMLLKM